MKLPTREHQAEAERLLELPGARARAELGDRIARAFLLDGPDLQAELEYNALLATALREHAQLLRHPGLWA